MMEPAASPIEIFEDKKALRTSERLLRRWFRLVHPSIKLSPIMGYAAYCLGMRNQDCPEVSEVLKNIHNDLGGRADQIYGYIAPYLSGNILDIGCGDGSIADKIRNATQKKVTLTDVVDFPQRREKTRGLDFHLIPKSGRLPFKDNQFDTSLLVTVLHHSKDPLKLLEEAVRVTSGPIAIVESVYGVRRSQDPAEEVAKYPYLYNLFHQLNMKQQKAYGNFIDYFLNKFILGNNAACHYNFNSFSGWKKLFRQKGLKILEARTLGFDQPVTPEYHAFYAIKK